MTTFPSVRIHRHLVFKTMAPTPSSYQRHPWNPHRQGGSWAMTKVPSNQQLGGGFPALRKGRIEFKGDETTGIPWFWNHPKNLSRVHRSKKINIKPGWKLLNNCEGIWWTIKSLNPLLFRGFQGWWMIFSVQELDPLRPSKHGALLASKPSLQSVHDRLLGMGKCETEPSTEGNKSM